MTELVNQPTYTPTRKITAVGVSGIVSVAILAALDEWVPGLGELMSEYVYAVVPVVIATFSGWFIKERKQ